MFSFDLMFQPLRKYFDFQGRARRSEYWLWVGFQFVLGIVYNVLQSAGGAVAGLAAGLSLLTGLGFFIPNISAGVRRFHDTNRTGLWTLFWPSVYIVSFIVAIVVNLNAFAELGQTMQNMDSAAIERGDPEAVMAFLTAMGPLALWVFLPTWIASLVTFVFHVLDGTPGQNRFGADPKGRGEAEQISATFG